MGLKSRTPRRAATCRGSPISFAFAVCPDDVAAQPADAGATCDHLMRHLIRPDTDYRAAFDLFMASRVPAACEATVCGNDTASHAVRTSGPDRQLYAAQIAQQVVCALQAGAGTEATDSTLIEQAIAALPVTAARQRYAYRDDTVAAEVRRLLVGVAPLPDALPEALPAPLRELAARLHAEWSAISGAFGRFVADVAAQRAALGDAFELGAAFTDHRVMQSGTDEQAYRRLREAFVAHYTVGAAPFALDDQPLYDVFFSPVPLQAFTPYRAMAGLFLTFGASAHDAQRAAAARTMVRAFALRAADEVRTVRGHVVLELRMAIDSLDKRFHKRSRYCISSQLALQAALSSLGDVLVHLAHFADGAAARAAVEIAVAMLRDANWEPSPALRPQLGPCALRCFQTRIEFHVPEGLAANINAFVTTHAPFIAYH